MKSQWKTYQSKGDECNLEDVCVCDWDEASHESVEESDDGTDDDGGHSLDAKNHS